MATDFEQVLHVVDHPRRDVVELIEQVWREAGLVWPVVVAELEGGLYEEPVLIVVGWRPRLGAE